MKKIVGLCYVVALGVPLTGHAVNVVKTAELQDKAEIASAVRLAKSTDTVQLAMRHCTDKGVPHESCLCQNKQLVNEQSALIKDALMRHPGWLSIGWFKFKDENGKYRTFNAKGLQKQSEMKLNCM